MQLDQGGSHFLGSINSATASWLSAAQAAPGRRAPGAKGVGRALCVQKLRQSCSGSDLSPVLAADHGFPLRSREQ